MNSPTPRRTIDPSSYTAAGDLAVDADLRGLRVRDTSDRGFWARITSHVGNNTYAWARVDDGNRTFPDGNFTGHFRGNGTRAPAHEVNGNTTVPSGTKVWLEPKRQGLGYTFSVGGGGGGALQDCGVLAGLSANSCLNAEIASGLYECANVPAGNVAMEYDSGNVIWASAATINVARGNTTLYFTPGNDTTQGQPRAWLGNYTAAGNVSIPRTWLTLADCANDTLTYRGGLPHCGDNGAGTRGSANCPPDTFAVTFSCRCCASGWAGAGYYCLERFGVANLTTCPPDNYTILGGPYANATIAASYCANFAGNGYYCADYNANWPNTGNTTFNAILASACWNLGFYADLGNWTLANGPFTDPSGCLGGNECSGGDFADMYYAWALGYTVIANVYLTPQPPDSNTIDCPNQTILGILFVPTSSPGTWQSVNVPSGTAFGNCTTNAPLTLTASGGDFESNQFAITIPLNSGNVTTSPFSASGNTTEWDVFTFEATLGSSLPIGCCNSDAETPGDWVGMAGNGTILVP